MSAGMLSHMAPKERLGYACLAGLMLFAFGYVGARHLRQPAPIVFDSVPKNTAAQPISQPASSAAAEDKQVVVHVAGAVAHPGVVRLLSGARVVDAIHAAGGPVKGADLDSINLAAKLIDGSQVRIPTKQEVVAASIATHKTASTRVVKADIDKSGQFTPVTIEPSYLAASITPAQSTTSSQQSATPTQSKPSGWAKKQVQDVNVNTATVEELQSLPGVGPSTAQKIFAFRQEHGPYKSADDLLDVPGIGEKKLAKMRDHVKI